MGACRPGPSSVCAYALLEMQWTGRARESAGRELGMVPRTYIQLQTEVQRLASQAARGGLSHRAAAPTQGPSGRSFNAQTIGGD